MCLANVLIFLLVFGSLGAGMAASIVSLLTCVWFDVIYISVTQIQFNLKDFSLSSQLVSAF